MNDNDVKNNSFEKRVEETINVVVKKSNNKDFEINNKVDSKKTSKIVVDSDVLKKNVEGNSNKTTKLNDKDVKNNSFEERVEETINDVVKKSNNKDFEAFEVYKEILQCGEDIKCGKENIKKKSNADLENAKGSKKISKKRNGKSKSNENDQNINKNKSFERRIDETIDEVIKNSKNDYDSQKINENESIKTLKPQESVEIENNLDTILTSTPKLTRKHQNEILTQEILDIINNVEETRKNKLMQRFMKGETSKSIGNHDDLKGDVKKNATKIYEKRNSIETFLTSTPKSNQNELILSKNQEKEGLNEILTKEIIENDESKKDKINKKSKKCEVTKSDENCGGVTKKGVKITRIDEKGTNLDTDLMATRKSNQDELILSKNQGKKGSNEISTQEIIDVIESVDESKKDKTNKTSKKGEVAKFNENCDDLKGGGKKKEVKTTRIDEKGTNLDIDLMATQKNNQDELILPKNQGEKGSNEISTQEIIDVIESVDESKKDKTNKRSKKGEVAKSNENCDDLKGGGKKKGAKAAKNDEKENDLDTVLMSTTKSNQDELILSKNQGEKGSKEISTQEIIDVIESVDKSKKEKRIKRCKIDEVAKSVENCDNLKEGGKKKGLKATKIDEKGNNLDVLMSTSKSNQDELISPKDEGDKSCNEISTQEIIDVIESADESKKNKRIKGSVKKKGLKAAKIDEKENNLDTFLTSTPKSSQDELISPKDQGEKSCNEISTQEIIDVIESVDESKKDKRIKGGVKKKGIKAAKIDEKENNLDTFLSNQHELISPKNPEDKVSYEKDETSKSVGNCDDLEKSIKKKDISTPITPKLTSESDKITSSSSMNQEPNNKDHESNQDLKNEDVVELEKKLQSKENVQIGNELERKVVPNRRSPRIKQPTIIKKLSLKKLKSSDDVEKDGKENLSQQDEIRCESVNIANVKNINPDLIGQTEAIKKNNVHVSPRKSPRLKSKTSLDKSENINVENDESSLIKSEKEELNKSLDDENVLKKRKKPSSPKKDVKKIKINLDFLTPRDKSKKNDKENSILNYLTNSKNSDDLNRESKPENDSNKSKETISFPEITSQEIFDQENEVCITKHKRKNMIEDAIIAKQAEILNDAITNQLEANNSDINEDVVTNTSISLLIPETTVSEYIGNEFGESLFVNCGEEISEVNETNELESDETIKRKSYESDVSKKFKSSPKQTVIKKKSKKLPSNRNIFEDSVDESSSNESVADEKMIRLIEKAVERVLERKFGKRKKKQLNNSRDSKRFKKDSFSSNESKCRSEKRKLTPGPQKKIKKDNKKKYLIIKNTDSNDSTSENGDTSDQDFGEKRISNLNSNISNLSSNSSNGCSSKQSSLDIRTSLVMKCLDTIHTTKTNRRKIIEESSSSNNSDIEPDEVSNEFIDAISEAQFHMNTSSSRYDTIRGLQIKIDFEVPELHKVTTRISRGLITKHQQDVLNEKNIEILKDHYSSKEDFLIYTNFSRFCEVHNLENNPSPFLKLSSNKRSLLTPTQKVKFLQFIGKGLDQRPLCSIYLRFKNLMAKRKMGKFTQEEDAVVLNCANKLNKTKLAALEYILRRPKASILKRYEELTSNNVDMM
nr:uncharacterized protein PF11_0213-like [Onthophagus taurus]